MEAIKIEIDFILFKLKKKFQAFFMLLWKSDCVIAKNLKSMCWYK